MRLELRVLRRPGRGVPGRRAGGDRRLRQLGRLPAAGRGAGHHALELPLLAGAPVRRPGPHGRQRRPAQALAQRARLRPGRRGAAARAGLPPGLFRALLVADASVTEATGRLLADPRVAAVTLTGSARAGAAVGAGAGRALKKCVLELGGSDPFLVLADADLELAAEAAARARFLNAGQSCIAAKRFIVEEPVADEFEQRFAAAVAALPVGDPLERTTRIGPLARADLLTALERQVEGSVAEGARVLLGGRRLAGPGWFHEPTVLADVTPGMPVFREETFGPVAAVVRAADEEAAVGLANDTPYGLGASLWTRDTDRAQRLGRRIQSGSLFVNALVASDPRLPFGGVKRSGHGRELAAVGIREFTNIRTFWVQPAGAAPPATLTE